MNDGEEDFSLPPGDDDFVIPPPPVPPLRGPPPSYGWSVSRLLRFLFVITMCSQMGSASVFFPTEYNIPAPNFFGAEFSSDPEGDGPSRGRCTRSQRALRPSPQPSALFRQLNEEKETNRKTNKTRTVAQNKGPQSQDSVSSLNNAASSASQLQEPDPREPASLVDDDLEPVDPVRYDVEMVCEMRVTNSTLQFGVKWLGCDYGEDQWQPADTMFEDVPHLVAKFLKTCDSPSVPKYGNKPVARLTTHNGRAAVQLDGSSKLIGVASFCYNRPISMALFLEQQANGDGYLSEDSPRPWLAQVNQHSDSDSDLANGLPEAPPLHPGPNLSLNNDDTFELVSSVPQSFADIQSHLMPLNYAQNTRLV